MEINSPTTLNRLWQRLARPIVLLLIKNGVMYQTFARWSKRTYVDVAEQNFGKRGRPTNQSRIALLTGLDRKDIRRVLDERKTESDAPDARPASDRLGRVLGGWYQDARFATDGEPHALEVEGEFSELCRDYGGDVPNSTILKELEQGGAVRRLLDNRVLPKSRYYMPASSDPEAVKRAAEVYRDLGQALLHNLYRYAETPPRFEGRASNPRIATRHVEEFRALIDSRGQAFLEEIDNWLHEKESQTNENEPTVRLGIGLYAITDDETSDA